MHVSVMNAIVFVLPADNILRGLFFLFTFLPINGRPKHGCGIVVELTWPQSNQKFSIQQTV